MQIRLAQERDLAAAAQLWRERLFLLQQSDPSILLAPNALAAWTARAKQWLAAEDHAFFVAERQGAVVGYIVLTIVDGPAGLMPERLGALLELAVDLHEKHTGLSGGLLAQAKSWLRERGIRQLQIEAPAYYPVEDAFWQGQGARPRGQTYWLKL